MPCNGNLAKSIVSLINQASKAMFAMFTKSKKLGREVDVQLQLFDSLVQPIMLYYVANMGLYHYTGGDYRLRLDIMLLVKCYSRRVVMTAHGVMYDIRYPRQEEAL